MIGCALVFSLLAKGYWVGTPSCWRRLQTRIRRGDNHANNIAARTRLTEDARPAFVKVATPVRIVGIVRAHPRPRPDSVTPPLASSSDQAALPKTNSLGGRCAASEGVAGWNAWRNENPNVPPNVLRQDLNGADLRDTNLSAAQTSA